jgi:hypothetical protein
VLVAGSTVEKTPGKPKKKIDFSWRCTTTTSHGGQVVVEVATRLRKPHPMGIFENFRKFLTPSGPGSCVV